MGQPDIGRFPNDIDIRKIEVQAEIIGRVLQGDKGQGLTLEGSRKYCQKHGHARASHLFPQSCRSPGAINSARMASSN